MSPTVIRVSALLLGLTSLAGLYLAWFAIAVAMGFGSVFQLPLLICVGLLSASPLLLTRAAHSRRWSTSLNILRWLGLAPFVVGLYFAVRGLIQFVFIEGRVVYGLWSGLVLIAVCITALLWPEIRYLWRLRNRRL